MADRKVTVEVKVKLQIRADEGVEIGKIMDEMNYDFTYLSSDADVEDTEIIDYEVRDSR